MNKGTLRIVVNSSFWIPSINLWSSYETYTVINTGGQFYWESSLLFCDVMKLFYLHIVCELIPYLLNKKMKNFIL